MNPGTSIRQETTATEAWTTGAWVVVGAALLMGLPTLWGTFAFGDDHQLVLNHVLVNHPSIAHAIELFRIIHRDLYQPLPLLSFQIEFAIAGALGLLDHGIEGGAWFFHLNNVLLHALNAFLVWKLACRVAEALHSARGKVIALVAGVLFAVHPLQVEVVAWINGRMMLLSTLFALLALLALARWLLSGGFWCGAAVVLCAVCCQISKVRVEFPLLMLLIIPAHRQRFTAPCGNSSTLASGESDPSKRPRSSNQSVAHKGGCYMNRATALAGIWFCCAVITAAATVVNYQATDRAGMFEGAAANLTGPGVVRALRSLAWYFEHFLIPIRLAPWYPAPGVVRWWEWETLRAVLTLLPVGALAVWSVLRNRPLAGGLVWFLLAMATTVQLVPTRNTLAADRYMYLPIVGLAWTVGIAAAQWARTSAEASARGMRRWAGAPATLGVLALLALSWHTGWFYNEPLRKIMRIATLFPDSPHVWERAGWAYYHDEQYERAIELAERDLKHDDLDVRSDALEVIGAAQLKLRRYGAALESLHQAIEADPEKPGSYYRLATVLEEVGRNEEALDLYAKAVGMAPLKNPWILRLASIYREVGRTADARRMLEQALRNNPYDIPATLSLAELDIAMRTPEGYVRAERRLRALLVWEPHHVQARNHLGVVLNSMGRTAEAIELYGEVLDDDPTSVTAALNLAAIYDAGGDVLRAREGYLRAAEQPLVFSEMLAIHDFLVEKRDFETLLVFWARQLAKLPQDIAVREMELWSRGLAGRMEEVSKEWTAAAARTATHGPDTMALSTWMALAEGRNAEAVTQMRMLVRPSPALSAVRRRLLTALEVYDENHPGNPWTYCLTARMLLAEGNDPAGRAFTGLCRDHCADDTCPAYVRELELLIGAAGPSKEGGAKKE